MNGNVQVQVPNQPAPGSSITEDLFIYLISTSNLAAATGTANVSVQVQADSDFKLIKLTQFSNNHAAITNQTESTRVLPLVTVQITDTGSGRNLFSAAVPIPNLFGDGRIPFILPIARIFKARSTITVAFANYDTALAYDLNLALIGTKLFYMN